MYIQQIQILIVFHISSNVDNKEKEQMRQQIGDDKEWRMLQASDFRQPASSIDQWVDNIRLVFQNVDPHVKIKKKDEKTNYVRYEVSCQCAGTYKRKNIATKSHKESKKCDCMLHFSITVDKEGQVTSLIDDSFLKHSNHVNNYKSTKLFTDRIPIEQILPKSKEIEGFISNYDMSAIPTAEATIIAVQMAFYNGKRFDKAAKRHVRRMYYKVISKDDRILSMAEMIEEITNDSGKYRHYIEYAKDDPTQVIFYIIRHRFVYLDIHRFVYIDIVL